MIWVIPVRGPGPAGDDFSHVQRFKIILFLMGPWVLGSLGHDPYGSQSARNGSHHWCFYSWENLRYVPRTQIVNSWWVPLSFYGYMTQDAAISESLHVHGNKKKSCYWLDRVHSHECCTSSTTVLVPCLLHQLNTIHSKVRTYLDFIGLLLSCPE